MAVNSSPATLARDEANQAIQVMTKFSCDMRTGSTLVAATAAAATGSPKTGVGTTPVCFLPPLSVPSSGGPAVPSACAFVFKAVNAATATKIFYGDNPTLDGSAAGKGYHTAALNQDLSLPCQGMTSTGIWIKTDAGTVDIEGHWEVL